jgi:hypothetical protein
MLPDSLRAGVGEVALAVKTSVLNQLGGTRRMSGVGRSGARIGVGYDVKGLSNPTAIVKARGPLHLLEYGTRPHRIEPRRGGARALRVPAARRGFAMHVNHPGTTGKYPWAKGVAKAMPHTPVIFARAVRRAILKTFT